MNQEVVTERYENWKKRHPEESARRIDYINGEEVQGIKYYYATESGEIVSFANQSPNGKYLKYEHTPKGYARTKIYDKHLIISRVIMETFKDKIEFFPKGLPIQYYDAHHMKKEKHERENGTYFSNELGNLQGVLKEMHDVLHSLENLNDMTDKQKEDLMSKAEKYSDVIYINSEDSKTNAMLQKTPELMEQVFTQIGKQVFRKEK